MKSDEVFKYLTGEVAEVTNHIDGKRVIILEGKRFHNISLYADIKYPYEIHIDKCVIDDTLYIIAGEFVDRVIIKNCKAKNIVVNGGSFLQGLFINNCEIGDGIVIARAKERTWFPASVSIEVNKAKYIAVNNLDFEYLAFHNNTVDRINVFNTLVYKDESTGEQKQLSSQIKYVNFSLEEGTRFLMSYLDIEKLTFNGSFDRCELVFEAIRTGYLLFEDFIKTSSSVVNIMRLGPLDEKSMIVMRNSLFGDTSFYDCDFAGFTTFQIANSQLSGIRYAHTSWPKELTTAGPDRLSPGTYNNHQQDLQLREVYRQLKFSAISQSDKLMEAFFYRLEMIYLNKTLSKRSHLGSKIVLILSRYSNNHKQNWFLPIGWLFTLNLFCTILLSSATILELKISWVCFFHLLNPAHRFSDLLVPESFATLFIDFISRVLTGFLIYQTVAAFRKLS